MRLHTRCEACGKFSYLNRLGARVEVMRALFDEEVYLDDYRCPHGPVWHVRNLEKRVAHRVASGFPSDVERRELARLRAFREQRWRYLGLTPTPRQDLDLPERRRQLNKAIGSWRQVASELPRVPRTTRARRRRRRAFVPYRRRRSHPSRVRSARSQVVIGVARMLTRTNDFRNHGWFDTWGGRRIPRRCADVVRRLNRAREREQVRDTIDEELSYRHYPLDESEN